MADTKFILSVNQIGFYRNCLLSDFMKTGLEKSRARQNRSDSKQKMRLVRWLWEAAPFVLQVLSASSQNMAEGITAVL